MASPLVTTSPLAELWQRSRSGITVLRNADRPAPTDWEPWVRTLFPKYVRHPFADRHVEAWEWAWAIDYTDAPAPFVGIWSRGGGKSTNVELITAALGVRSARRYALYLRETQSRADDSVTNVGAMLESPELELYYPMHAERAVDKYGSSRGWRRNRLRTRGGFTVDAMGLDSAARGAKVEEQRPDLIILDDIDGKHDTPHETAKKIATITTSILPAGADNVAVIAVQNLIHPDGFFSRMVDGRADYLTRRHLSGPHPAIIGLATEMREEPAEDGGPPTRRAMIVKGEATWEGQSLATCQKQIDEWGLEAFEKEAQHDVFERREGLALNFDKNVHYVDMSREQIRHLVGLGQAFGGIDFGAWRFMFTAWAADTVGRVIRIEEYFSQRDEMKVRAKAIHDKCVAIGVLAPAPIGEARLRLARFPIWGDSANPTDMLELNAAWRDGWPDPATGKLITSPLRVVGVGKGPGMVATAIERINNKLGEGALLYVRSVGVGDRWRLGYSAGRDGTPMTGSRLMWETTHWAYPTPADGIAQKQVPDDNTADGADGIASKRYALMSWWRPGKEKEPDDDGASAFSPAMLAADAHRSNTIRNRLGRTAHRRGAGQIITIDED